jgi:hypothetical protein
MVSFEPGALSQISAPINNLPYQDSGTTATYNTVSNMNSVWGNKDPNYIYSTQQPDSNTEYKHIVEGLVMQGGQLKIVRNGYLFIMHGAFPLKNGAFIFTDGIIKMPNGATPLLDEKSYIDFDGRIRPLQ